MLEFPLGEGDTPSPIPPAAAPPIRKKSQCKSNVSCDGRFEGLQNSHSPNPSNDVDFETKCFCVSLAHWCLEPCVWDANLPGAMFCGFEDVTWSIEPLALGGAIFANPVSSFTAEVCALEGCTLFLVGLIGHLHDREPLGKRVRTS